MRTSRILCLIAATSIPIAALSKTVIDNNSVYSRFPPSMTFKAGIDSNWIPYGTYSGGVQTGPEYTRYTSNLVGVTCSIIDGTYERTNILRAEKPGEPWVFGEYISPGTTRVLDILNLHGGRRTKAAVDYEGVLRFEYDSATVPDQVKTTILAVGLGGTTLELLLSTEKSLVCPLPTSWTWASQVSTILSNGSAWKNYLPVYIAADDAFMHEWRLDPYHSPLYWESEYGYRPHIFDMFYGLPLTDQLYDKLWELANYFSENPTSAGLQDIINFETGMSMSDIADHFTNGTMRLDWKRLGILCQMEKQFNVSYGSVMSGSEYTAYNYHATCTSVYETSVPVHEDTIEFVEASGGSGYWRVGHISTNSISGWTKRSDYVNLSTNRLGTDFSTVRWKRPQGSAGIETSLTGNGGPLELSKTELETSASAALGGFASNMTCRFSLAIDVSSNQAGIFWRTGAAAYLDENGNVIGEKQSTGKPIGSHGPVPGLYDKIMLSLNAHKVSDAIYTTSTESEIATNLVSSLGIAGLDWMWNGRWLKNVTSFRTEMMEEAVNCDNLFELYDDGMDASRPLPWDDLPDEQRSAEPRLRTNPLSAMCTSKDQYLRNMVAQARGLNDEVHNRFANIAGSGVMNLVDSQSTVSQEDIDKLLGGMEWSTSTPGEDSVVVGLSMGNSLKDAHMVGSVSFDENKDATATVYRIVTTDDPTGSITNFNSSTSIGDRIIAGSWSLSIEGTAGSSLVLSNTLPCRVDGYSTRTTRSEYRFRNLHEPD